MVRTDLASDAWPVRIDVGEFELVILNLCVNARDAMPDGGSIDIRTRNLPDYKSDKLAGDFVAVTVTDTGTGMSAETIAHAFEPFFTTKDIGKGSGLGLAQAYGFARSSNGSLKIHSELGHGTTVELLLPRSLETPVSPVPTQLTKPEGKKPEALLGRVLLVEDDNEVAEFTGEMLVEIGFTVTRVSDARGALNLLADGKKFDLVFSDIMMPGGMNGIQLGEEMQKRHYNVPLLLTSGHASAFTDQAAALNVKLIAKPFGIEDLEEYARGEIASR